MAGDHYGAWYLPATYIHTWARRQRENRAIQEAALTSGLTEPASLHPIIDEQRCIGCGACANACPEDRVLGVIGAKAALINPSHCIGHGACKAARWTPLLWCSAVKNAAWTSPW